MNRGWGGFGCAVGIELKDTADTFTGQRAPQTNPTSGQLAASASQTSLGRPARPTVSPSSNTSPASGSRITSILPIRTHPTARHSSPRVEPYQARAPPPARSGRPDLSRVQGEGRGGGLTNEQVLTLSAYYTAAQVAAHVGSRPEDIRSRLARAVKQKAAAESKTPHQVKDELNLLRFAHGAIPEISYVYGVRPEKARQSASVAVDFPARPARESRQPGSSSSSSSTNKSGRERTAPSGPGEAGVDKISESTISTASDSLPSDMEVDDEDFEPETPVDFIPEDGSAKRDLPQPVDSSSSGEYEVDYLLDWPTPGPPGGDWDAWDSDETYEPREVSEHPAYVSAEYTGTPKTPGGFFDDDAEEKPEVSEMQPRERNEEEECESDEEIWSQLNVSHLRR